MTKQFFLLFLLFLGGCKHNSTVIIENQESLEKRTWAKIEQKFNKKHLQDEVLANLEAFEEDFPKSVHIPDSIYKRGEISFKLGELAEAIAIFETFVENFPNDSRCLSAYKYIFFCYYNCINIHGRNSDLIAKAFATAEKMDLSMQAELQNELEKLHEFIILEKVTIMQTAQFTQGEWIQMLWVATKIIKSFASNELSAEAFFRIIELLIQQPNESLKSDAIVIYRAMYRFHPTSIWTKKANLLIKKYT